MARTPAVSASVDTRLDGAGGGQQHKVTLLPLTTVDANLQVRGAVGCESGSHRSKLGTQPAKRPPRPRPHRRA